MTQHESAEVILVVDDSPDLLSFVNDALEEAGYSVLVALEGRQALTISRRIRPDLVLLDACMPGMDGFDTCRELKKNPELTAIPVVFMTGLGDSSDVVRGLAAGGVDYLTKPVDPDELVARIGVHLRNARITNSAYKALDTSGQFLVIADANGELTWLSPQACALLGSRQLNNTQKLDDLAVLLSRWLDTSQEPGETHKLELGDASLTATLVEQVKPGEFLLRLQPAQREDNWLVLKKSLALTNRESEVLYWLSNGKTNREIAEILDMSHRTVNKHLEQIFPKLGVENRTAAARVALKTLAGQ